MTSLPVFDDPNARRAFTLHDRRWRSNRYVYPVVSRRSKGISIGVNLNPNKLCNLDCIYCSVDRSGPRRGAPEWAAGELGQNIDLTILGDELARMLSLVTSGEMFRLDPFDKIPPALARLNDIAFSGDGEPTTCPQFDAAVRLAAELLESGQWPAVDGRKEATKLVVITNATMFHRAVVRETLAFLDGHRGEIWAKLDAGTAAYYQLVDRANAAFERVLENLLWCCQTRPTVIQSLFMAVHGQPPADAEIEAYAARLAHIVSHGGRIKLVQLYTVARTTTEAFATALSAEQLQAIGARVAGALGNVPIEVFPQRVTELDLPLFGGIL